MITSPSLAVPAAETRAAAVRVAAVGLDRRDAVRLVDREAVLAGGEAAPGAGDAVHPMAPSPSDPLSAALLAAARAARRPSIRRRALLTPATLPSGLDPERDAALARLDGRARLGLVLRVALGWEAARIGAALDVPPADVPGLLAAARAQVPGDDDELARHVASRMAAAPVSVRRAPAGRRIVPLAAAAILVLGLALFAGAASAPLPDVAGPLPDVPALVETAALELPGGPLEEVAAATAPALRWDAARMPAGVAFRWVVPAGDGFVAMGVDPDEATAPLVTPVGFWTSSDGTQWQPLAARDSSFALELAAASMAAAPSGAVVVVGGEPHPGTPGAVVRPVAWRLDPGHSGWARAGLRTPPVGRPINVRMVYRDLAVVAAGGEFAAFAVAEPALTGRRLPAGFEYRPDEGGVTLAGPGGAPVERLEYAQLGIGEQAAARLVAGARRQEAWRSPDGLRWAPVPLGYPDPLGAVAHAAGRYWAATGRGVASSADAARWGAVDVAGLAVGAIAGHSDLVVMTTGGRTVIVGDRGGWRRVVLPPATGALSGARVAAAGGAGAAAFGTMGSDVGEVVVPQVTVPGLGGRLEVDLFLGTFAIVGPDGAKRHEGRYFDAGNFEVDLASGTFAVIDAAGTSHFTGRIEDWAAAMAAAYRTPYPPDGEIALWFSPDGEAWRFQTPGDGLGARGFPSAVAVGPDRVVVAATRPARQGTTAAPQVWVGTVEP